ncbi:MAG: dihydrolipoyl dehydrogenase [Opitutales bacterium]|jgi:dihydrolipoamide dehydrogenase|nr:dihydrolipoyl dehydrogenase [Opitutales bacterium]
MSQLDLVVIGSGPGGYVAAIKAAQLGLKVALVEKDPVLGGTCLNVGCIPSKALLHSTEVFHQVTHGKKHGLVGGEKVTIDVPAMMANKDKVVSQLNQGVKFLVSKRGIEIVQGLGRLDKQPGKVLVRSTAGERTLETKNIIIATGSSIVELPFMKFDGESVISSDHGIALKSVPEKMVVVGSGAIGLELGSVWARLGAQVTVVEMLSSIGGPAYDEDVAKVAQQAFEKQGIKFELGAKVTGVKKSAGGMALTAERDGKPLEFPADKILVAVGRKANTQGLGAAEAGLKLDERGRVVIDDHFRTNLPGVYAIGDVVTGPMLAHKAEEEGVAAAEIIAGKAGHVNYNIIPGVIYTDPEIAGVGMLESEAKAKNIEVKVGKFQLAGNGRAIATDATTGFVKVIADAKTDKVLGVQIVARGGSEMIAAACAHMEYGASAEDIARTCFAHPTISESFKEAAMAVSKSSIHSL